MSTYPLFAVSQSMSNVLTPVEVGTGGLPNDILGREGEEYKVKSLMLPWLLMELYSEVGLS